MEEKEIVVNGKKIKVITKLPKEYIEDNNLKVFLDDTVNLEEVVNKITSNNYNEKVDELTNECE